jgi:hypothetical protein
MSLFREIIREPARVAALKSALARERAFSRRKELGQRHLQGAISHFFRRLSTPTGESLPLPRPLSSRLADAFDSLTKGYLHPLVTPFTKKSGERTPPDLRKCQVKALQYIELAHRKVICDASPAKTVCNLFGVTDRAVRIWRRALKPELAAVLNAPGDVAEFTVPRELHQAAASYRRERNSNKQTGEDIIPPPRPLRGMTANRKIGAR